MADQEKLFTQAQAQELLPELRVLFERLRELQRGTEESAAIIAAHKAVGSNGSAKAASSLVEAGTKLAAILSEFSRLGVILKDPQVGLIDFPAEREGAPIYLCWQTDEPTVGYWHGRDQSFEDRQPL